MVTPGKPALLYVSTVWRLPGERACSGCWHMATLRWRLQKVTIPYGDTWRWVYQCLFYNKKVGVVCNVGGIVLLALWPLCHGRCHLPMAAAGAKWTGACCLSLTRRKLRPSSANHEPGYWNNLPCDWPSTALAYSEWETENRPRSPGFSGCWWPGACGSLNGWPPEELWKQAEPHHRRPV